MPYADHEKRKQAKRESAQRRRATDPEAERAYDRAQKQRRRDAVHQAAGPPERATRSVAADLGRTDDFREGFRDCQGLPGTTASMLPDYDRWTPLSGWWGLTRSFGRRWKRRSG